MKRKLRMGMIGGGKGAFIGAVHRIAANLDGLIELRCGALSSRPDNALASGRELFLDESRIYPSYEEMIRRESQLDPDTRMDFVAIVTPNHAHFAPAIMALENGFHVVLDKPMTISVDEARQLKKKVDETGLLFCLTHTYSGYPLVKHARRLVREGAFGRIRKIMVEYPQGWLSRPEEKGGNAQASWRTDPARGGKAGCMADIGTHAAHLAEYVSGLKITEICASLNRVVEGRLLDDDGDVLLRFEQGATGVLSASQIAAGEENNIKIRIYGEKGGLEWQQHDPNTLYLKWLDQPMQVIRAGANYSNILSDAGLAHCRTPSGHPEGYLEAFANLYRNFALALSARLEGLKHPEHLDFPGAEDGLRGMAFIENVVASSASSQKWYPHTV